MKNISLVKLVQSEVPELIGFITKSLLDAYPTDKIHISLKGDYVYAEGTIPIMLVCHMDTVHRTKPENVFYDPQKKVAWCPEGIGGDDRCGVWSVLTILRHGFRPSVLFTNGEETGLIGARAFAKDFPSLSHFKFMIELDRRGSEDCVFYQCGNKEFQTYIESFGFKTAIGSSSDIKALSPVFNRASVNLSIGYYNEHTLNEYVRLDEMQATTDKVEKILSVNPDVYPVYDFQEVKYVYTGYSGRKWNYETRRWEDDLTTDDDDYYQDRFWTAGEGGVSNGQIKKAGRKTLIEKEGTITTTKILCRYLDEDDIIEIHKNFASDLEVVETFDNKNLEYVLDWTNRVIKLDYSNPDELVGEVLPKAVAKRRFSKIYKSTIKDSGRMYRAFYVDLDPNPQDFVKIITKAPLLPEITNTEVPL